MGLTKLRPIWAAEHSTFRATRSSVLIIVTLPVALSGTRLTSAGSLLWRMTWNCSFPSHKVSSFEHTSCQYNGMKSLLKILCYLLNSPTAIQFSVSSVTEVNDDSFCWSWSQHNTHWLHCIRFWERVAWVLNVTYNCKKWQWVCGLLSLYCIWISLSLSYSNTIILNCDSGLRPYRIHLRYIRISGEISNYCF